MLNENISKKIVDHGFQSQAIMYEISKCYLRFLQILQKLPKKLISKNTANNLEAAALLVYALNVAKQSTKPILVDFIEVYVGVRTLQHY